MRNGNVECGRKAQSITIALLRQGRGDLAVYGIDEIVALGLIAPYLWEERGCSRQARARG
jgi:hypothetical protein